MLKPVSTLIRVPAFDGTTATFIGTLRLPLRNVTPAARASATPAGVMLGPMPNSAPSRVRRPHAGAQGGETEARPGQVDALRERRRLDDTLGRRHTGQDRNPHDRDKCMTHTHLHDGMVRRARPSSPDGTAETF